MKNEIKKIEEMFNLIQSEIDVNQENFKFANIDVDFMNKYLPFINLNSFEFYKKELKKTIDLYELNITIDSKNNMMNLYTKKEKDYFRKHMIINELINLSKNIMIYLFMDKEKYRMDESRHIYSLLLTEDNFSDFEKVYDDLNMIHSSNSYFVFMNQSLLTHVTEIASRSNDNNRIYDISDEFLNKISKFVVKNYESVINYTNSTTDIFNYLKEKNILRNDIFFEFYIKYHGSINVCDKNMVVKKYYFNDVEVDNNNKNERVINIFIKLEGNKKLFFKYGDYFLNNSNITLNKIEIIKKYLSSEHKHDEFEENFNITFLINLFHKNSGIVLMNSENINDNFYYHYLLNNKKETVIDVFEKYFCYDDYCIKKDFKSKIDKKHIHDNFKLNSFVKNRFINDFIINLSNVNLKLTQNIISNFSLFDNNGYDINKGYFNLDLKAKESLDVLLKNDFFDIKQNSEVSFAFLISNYGSLLIENDIYFDFSLFENKDKLFKDKVFLTLIYDNIFFDNFIEIDENIKSFNYNLTFVFMSNLIKNKEHLSNDVFDGVLKHVFLKNKNNDMLLNEINTYVKENIINNRLLNNGGDIPELKELNNLLNFFNKKIPTKNKLKL